MFEPRILFIQVLVTKFVFFLLEISRPISALADGAPESDLWCIHCWWAQWEIKTPARRAELLFFTLKTSSEFTHKAICGFA